MTCQDCGCRLDVVKTMLLESATQRLRECKCGSRFLTIERVVKRLPVLPATSSQPPANHQVTTRQPPLSDLPPDISKQPVSPDLNPEASLLSEPRTRAKAKGRPTTNGYTGDFVEFWEGTTIHRGNKKPAFDAWVKVKVKLGSAFPEVKFIITRYNRWAETEQWLNGYAPYVATWINAHGWETEPEPYEFRARGNGVPEKVQAGRDSGKRFLERHPG